MLGVEGSVDATEVLVLHSADDAYNGDNGIHCYVHQQSEPTLCFVSLHSSDAHDRTGLIVCQ